MVDSLLILKILDLFLTIGFTNTQIEMTWLFLLSLYFVHNLNIFHFFPYELENINYL